MSQPSLDGIEPPIFEDPDYPPLIRELAGIVHRQLTAVEVPNDRALAMAEEVAEQVREHFGGQPLYWSKGESMRQRKRRERMWQQFDGRNYVEIARANGICLQQAYRAIGIARREHLAKVQGDMFTDQARPDGKAGGESPSTGLTT